MSLSKNELKDLAMRYFNLQPIETTSEENKQEFAKAELADGTVVTNNVEAEFEVGQELFVESEEGLVAAPEGEHTTASGIVVVVDAEGRISGIHRPDEEGEGDLEAAEIEETEEVKEMAEEEKPEEVVEMESVEEAVIKAIADVVMPEIENMKSELSSCMDRLAEQEEKMGQYEEKMKEYMSAQPASESKTAVTRFSKPKNNFKSMKPAKNERRYDGLLKSLTN